MSFSGDIKNFTKKTTAKGERVYRRTVLALFANIVRGTPVDTGRARANWNIEINTVDTSTSDNTTPKRPTLGGLKLTDNVFISNNLPYILPLEHGHSAQAPAGMVKTALLEFRGIVDGNARN
jgi:hypothetical protein